MPLETQGPVAAAPAGPPVVNNGPVGPKRWTSTAVTPLGAFHEIVVMASPLAVWIAGSGLAVMAADGLVPVLAAGLTGVRRNVASPVPCALGEPARIRPLLLI